MRAWLFTLAVALCVAPSIAYAQTEIDLWLSRRQDTTRLDSATVIGQKINLTRELAVKREEAVVADMHCVAPLNCTTLTVKLLPGSSEPSTKQPSQARGSSLEFPSNIFSGKEPLELQILSGTTEVHSLGLAEDAAAPAGSGGGGLPETVAALVTYDCSAELSTAQDDLRPRYSPSDNRARFLVAPNGNVYQRPSVDVIDENDIVEVWIVAHPDLLPALKVNRTSPFREPGVINIVGQDVELPKLGEQKGTPATTARRRCGRYVIQLGDFEPSRAEITLSAMTNQGDVATGRFEFGVNTLYIGAFALGAIRTELKAPTFGLAFNGTDSVITRIEDREPRVLYTLTYTPFIWGKRDLEKEEEGFLNPRRFNPIFGLVLSDVDDNFVVGVSYDLLSAVYLSFGLHLGRVRRLNPDAGYEVGDTFTGTRDQIPTTLDWRHDAFFGVSLDLRAATEFIKKAVSSPGG